MISVIITPQCQYILYGSVNTAGDELHGNLFTGRRMDQSDQLAEPSSAARYEGGSLSSVELTGFFSTLMFRLGMRGTGNNGATNGSYR